MIDPDIRTFVEESERFYPPDAASLPLAEQRRLYEDYARAFAVRRPETIVSRDATLAAHGRAVPLRRYTPAGTPHGLVLYAHGGGFMLGSLDSHDGIVARVAAETGAVVIAIDYRLAPEHPPPAALEDVRAVLAAANAGRLPWPDLPRSGLVLMGDSAGATLMASAALASERAQQGALAALALVYPALGYEPAEPARSDEARAPMLTLDDVLFYRSVYLAGRAPPPGTFVLDEPELPRFPPTFLLPAQHDPLRDDCTTLAERLRRSGTEVRLEPGTGLVHGFLRAIDRSPAAAEPFARLCGALGRCMPAEPGAPMRCSTGFAPQQGALDPNIA